jgi:hypothetical protein
MTLNVARDVRRRRVSVDFLQEARLLSRVQPAAWSPRFHLSQRATNPSFVAVASEAEAK